jgi:hypothetical protein
VRAGHTQGTVAKDYAEAVFSTLRTPGSPRGGSQARGVRPGAGGGSAHNLVSVGALRNRIRR